MAQNDIRNNKWNILVNLGLFLNPIAISGIPDDGHYGPVKSCVCMQVERL